MASKSTNAIECIHRIESVTRLGTIEPPLLAALARIVAINPVAKAQIETHSYRFSE